MVFTLVVAYNMDSNNHTTTYTAWPWCDMPATSLTDFAKDLATISDTHVIYLAPEEYTMNGGINVSASERRQLVYDLIDATTKRNVKISVVLGRHPDSFNIDYNDAFGDSCFNEIMQTLKNFVDVYFWKEFWFFKSGIWYLQHRIPDLTQSEEKQNNLHCVRTQRGLLVPQHVLTPDIKQVFCCLNRIPHPHRCRLVDELAGHPGVLDSNIVTWLMSGQQGPTNYPWRNWTETKMVKEQFCLSGGAPDYCATEPHGYEKTLFDVVPESDGDIVFWTEKTARSIVNFKPFLIAGGRHANRKLTELGFELYDDIFDYRFDEYHCYEERVTALANGLAALTEKSKDPANAQMLNNMYLQIRDKTYHNFENLLRIMQQQDQIPFRSEIKNAYPKYEDILKNNRDFVKNHFPKHSMDTGDA